MRLSPSSLGTTCQRATVCATFCENLLVLQEERKILCYPLTFEKRVIPKYLVAACQFRKGGAPRTTFWAFLFLFLGVTLTAVGIYIHKHAVGMLQDVVELRRYRWQPESRRVPVPWRIRPSGR